MTSVERIKPIRYPPVAPKSTEIPPRNPAKTGTPMSPINMYINIEIRLCLGESRAATRNTAKSWRVKEMPDKKGTEMYEQTAINATLMAMSVRS